jgi:hypothetical protein
MSTPNSDILSRSCWWCCNLIQPVWKVMSEWRHLPHWVHREEGPGCPKGPLCRNRHPHRLHHPVVPQGLVRKGSELVRLQTIWDISITEQKDKKCLYKNLPHWVHPEEAPDFPKGPLCRNRHPHRLHHHPVVPQELVRKGSKLVIRMHMFSFFRY